jgi:hypothetical protein
LLGDQSGCALIHYQGGAPNKRQAITVRGTIMSADDNNNGSAVVAPDGTQDECTGTAMPDMLSFEYNGTQHSIFMDLGTHDRAHQLYKDGNFEELLKFPVHSK